MAYHMVRDEALRGVDQAVAVGFDAIAAGGRSRGV